MSTVVAAWPRTVLEHAKARGLDPTRVATRAGVPLEALQRPDARIAAAASDAVWREVAGELGDPDLGIHVAESSLSRASFGLLGHVAGACATVHEALRTAERYQRLAMEHTRLELRPHSRGLTVIQHLGRRAPEARWAAEVLLASYVMLGRRWVGDDFAPSEVRFQHGTPGRVAELERFFRCPVLFHQENNALDLTRDRLAAPLASNDPRLFAYLRSCAEARMALLGRPSQLEKLRDVIADNLARGGVSVTQVARVLGVSSRSLQRSLQEEGRSFREVLEFVRHDVAVGLLWQGRTVADTAERLGFSDARAFRRAFRRWSGTTPSQLRLPKTKADCGGLIPQLVVNGSSR